ncbi:MAG: HyaD/HybD family hydrogenase maturation endopeptidase [Kiloniellales bacterium]|nr:HyaD/HybD family hydrogenase maturation endopeptidase [Kiloniellales bacterium]
MSILVLGLGNLLLSDEGVGVRVAEALITGGRLPPDVEVVDGGTSGMELLEIMMGRSLIVVADAISSERHRPGEIIRLDGAELDRFFRQRMSPHQIGLTDVLAALELMDAAPDRLVLFGVVPQSLELGLELTPPVAAARDRLVAAIEAEVATGRAVAPAAA